MVKSMQHKSQKKFKITRIKFIIYFLLTISLGMFLLSIWFSSEARQIRSQNNNLREKEMTLKSEISKLRIQSTRLQSPENVSKLADKLNMVRVEEPPIILEVK